MSIGSGRSRCCCRCAGICCAVVSFLLLAVGAAVTTIFAFVFREQLKELMPLANGSLSYRGWAKVPTDLTFEIWVWDVQNPDEVKRGGRPSLRQVGPFAFKESRYKSSIEFFPNNSVSFREFQVFHFAQELSVGSMENITVTSLNLPYAVTAFQLQNQGVSQTFQSLAHRYFARFSDGLFITRPVKEVLLGYEDNALRIVKRALGSVFPHLNLKSRTGLFIGRNNTDKGLFLVHTGRGDLNRFNEVLLWNGHPKIDVWPEDWANWVIGTDGSMFPPQVTRSRRLKIFTPDICRSLEMEFKEAGDVHGIPSLRFGPSPETMLNATLLPSNSAFCTPHCLDSGVLNITRCLGGIPLAVSAPHFTGAPTYADAIDGLRPGDEYRTLLDVEPNTGFVISAGRKMQMNFLLPRRQHFPDMSRLPELTLLPLMWLNESGGIQPEPARLFKQHLLAPIRIVQLLQWALLAAGLLLLLTVIAVVVVCRRRCCGRRGRSRSENGGRKSLPMPEQPMLEQPMLDAGGKQRDSVAVDKELISKILDASVPESDIC